MQHLFHHQSVLLEEAVKGLNVGNEGIYIDGTFGRGGHSQLILSQLGANGQLIGIDRDPEAIAVAHKIQDPRFSVIHGSFSHLAEYVEQRGLSGKIAGILLDLGVSSPQLEDPQRGFSFLRDGPLDMRMDPTQGISAAHWLQQAEQEEIAYVLKTYGEERFAKRIARAVVEHRKQAPLVSTKALAELVAATLPIKEKHKHPATRTFQAIRILVNEELQEIQKGLEAALLVLAPLGRLSVISFHSLEDRIVKQFMRDHSRGRWVPSRLPLTEAQLQAQGGRELRLLGKLKPSPSEIAHNPRSRSSVLRIAEKREA